VAIRILIVDDFQSWRRLVSAMLQDSPEFQIIGGAADGLEAVQKSEELQPDLILLAIGLPEFNGLGSRARNVRRRPGLENPVRQREPMSSSGARSLAYKSVRAQLCCEVRWRQ